MTPPRAWLSAADVSAFVGASLKAGLQLTPDQAKKFNRVSSAAEARAKWIEVSSDKQM
jgi:hypothetical protein